MSDKYRINPDFVPPDPTPADMFSYREDPGADGRHAVFLEEAALMRANGATQARYTITGPEFPDFAPVYPPGLWIEGWKDPKARQLPFGEAAKPGGPIYPPLTYAEQSQ